MVDVKVHFFDNILEFVCSYGLDVSIDRAEDVVLHLRILSDAKDPSKRPVFHVRFLKVLLIIQLHA